MRLSTKVAIALSLVVSVVGGIATFVAADRQAAAQRAQFRETNVRALELLGLALAPDVADGKHHRAQAVLDNVANFPDRYPDVRRLEVIDLRGRVMADMDPTRFGETVELAPLAAEAAMTDRGNGELEVVLPLRLAHPVGTLRATLTDARLELEVGKRKQNAAIFAVVSMTVLGFVLYLLHRRLLGTPIARLARVATKLRAGQMETRAPARRDDELGQLGQAFNEMAEHLQAYTSGLEEAVSVRTAALEAANSKLEELATTDALTGLCNRRHFESCGARDVAEAKRRQGPVSIVMSDIDRFKTFNDRFGHAVGDEVLRHVAKVFRSEVREMDLLARIGGEEFVVLMPDQTAEQAALAAERMRAKLEAEPIENLTDHVTASFGVACSADFDLDLGALMKAADDALYASKRDGRNRVTRAEACIKKEPA